MNIQMTIKNLIISGIVCSLLQVLPASAGVLMLNSGVNCQSKGFICDAITTKNQAADKHASLKTNNNCSAQTNKKPLHILWSQILVDLNKDESLTNVFDAFQASGLPVASELKDNFDYDIIADGDIQSCNVDEVPIPAAGWLFVSALLGFITFSNRRRV